MTLFRLRRAYGTAVASAAVALAASGVVAAAPAHASTGGASANVIVEAASADAAATAVTSVGGTVALQLPVVSAVSASVPADRVADLAAEQGVVVVPDVALHPTSASFDASSVDTQVATLDPGPSWGPDAGAGVGVALIDTGVANTPDISGDRLVRSPDFSGEGDGIDHFGHGTFMAGLIAGDGTASTDGGPVHTGVAPGATIVSVKVAGADGSTSLSRVIAGIGWAIANRDTYGIGVMNVSFGVDNPPMPYWADPLSGAVEAAWASGITVVAAAGNNGAGHVTSPGRDPYVVSVGATDTLGTSSAADDVVPQWSGNADFDGYSKPDVVAPGVSVVSLRAPGSTIDTQHPEGRVGDSYFRGTGTSMSTALVSGAAAVLLADHPSAMPDDVKGALVQGATTVATGQHEVDLAASDNLAPADWTQSFRVAFDGLGRGLHNGMPWTATRWAATRWAATRWAATRWAATRWAATRWAATRWAATRWSDQEWAASRWTSDAWSASRWTSTRWASEAWPSASWG